MRENIAAAVAAEPDGPRTVLGAEGARHVFRAVLTDNGPDFADEGAIVTDLGKGPGETLRPRQSDQEGV